MKQIIYLLILVILSFTLISCSSFPSSPPNLIVKSIESNASFKAKSNGGNWFDISSDGGNSGNSVLGDWEIVVAREQDAIIVSCNNTLAFELTNSKDSNEFKVYQIKGDNEINQELVEVDSTDLKISTPNLPGEYLYAIKASWDETHNIDFVFKIKCIE